MKPLRKHEQADLVIYQFNPVYSWILIICLILLVLSFVIENELFSMIVYSAFFIYFGLKVSLGSQYSKEIRQAIQEERAEIKGNKYSFTDPMSIVVSPANDAEIEKDAQPENIRNDEQIIHKRKPDDKQETH